MIHPQSLVKVLLRSCRVVGLFFVPFSSVEWRTRSSGKGGMVFEEEVESESAKDLKPLSDSPDERDYILIAKL